MTIRQKVKRRLWAVATAILALLFLILVPSLWRYWRWYPQVMSAQISLGGEPSPSSALYLDVARSCDGVVRLHTSQGQQLYAIGFGTCGNWRFAWRCEESGLSFLPALAFSSHFQFGQGCLAGNVTLADDRGNFLSAPTKGRNRNLKIGVRSISFVTDDDRLVNAEW